MGRLLCVLASTALMAGALSTPSSAHPWESATPWGDEDYSRPESLGSWGLPGRAGYPGAPGGSMACPGAGFGGSCPSPREQCDKECEQAYDEDVLACLSGRGGILPSQRGACYASANITAGICYARCRRLP